MKSIGQKFIENALLYPSKNALFVEGNYYTYSELLSGVSSIFHQIKAKGGNYERIGIFCTNDLITYSSILAISIYGAAYVPVNSNFPPEKNQDLINASGIELLIHSASCDLPFTFENGTSLAVETLNLSNTIQEINQLKDVVIQSIAYILFTSGTTGFPKAVAISKENLTAFFDFFEGNSDFNFTENDTFLQAFELTFDVSVFSFFMPLMKGACCYVVPNTGFRYLEILKMLKEKKITVATLVPTFLSFIQKYFSQLHLPNLKHSLFIGDKLSKKLTEQWEQVIPNAQIVNFYGPTEATVMCSFFIWNKNSKNQSLKDVVPIGKFFNSVVFEILNPSFENGCNIGELCIHGQQVISNYLNNTYKQKFIHISQKKFYRTGDLVSINEQGNLLFHGRIDSQVKINGFRVELFEIEDVLQRLTNARFALTCFENEEGINKIILFMENYSKQECDELEIKMKTYLPEYMLPSEVISLKNIPLNSNSKIDLVSLKIIYKERTNKN